MANELQRQALARDLARRLQLASHDELRVVDRLLGRLELGRERYAELDLAKPRDWRRERFEERLDALVYDVCEELVLEDAARAQLREQARAEMLRPVVPLTAHFTPPADLVEMIDRARADGAISDGQARRLLDAIDFGEAG